MSNLGQAGRAVVAARSASRVAPTVATRSAKPIVPVASTEVMTTEDHRHYFLSIEGALLKFGSLVLLPFRWEFGRDRSTKTTIVRWSFLGAVMLGMLLTITIAYQLWRPLSHIPSLWPTETEAEASSTQSVAKKIKLRAQKPPETRDVTRDNFGR